MCMHDTITIYTNNNQTASSNAFGLLVNETKLQVYCNNYS